MSISDVVQGVKNHKGVVGTLAAVGLGAAIARGDDIAAWVGEQYTAYQATKAARAAEWAVNRADAIAARNETYQAVTTAVGNLGRGLGNAAGGALEGLGNWFGQVGEGMYDFGAKVVEMYGNAFTANPVLTIAATATSAFVAAYAVLPRFRHAVNHAVGDRFWNNLVVHDLYDGVVKKGLDDIYNGFIIGTLGAPIRGAKELWHNAVETWQMHRNAQNAITAFVSTREGQDAVAQYTAAQSSATDVVQYQMPLE